MKRGKLLLIIPIILFSYIAYANLAPMLSAEQQDAVYFIDIGSETDTFGDAKLNGPMDRISKPMQETAVPSNITYRNLTKDLVYFDLTHPNLADHSKINVQVRFKDNFPQEHDFKLGAHNKEEWSYNWKAIYDPFHAKLEETFHPASSDDSYRIYSVNNPDMIKNVTDFLLHPPSGSTIAVEPDIKNKVNTEPDITINRSASLTINRTLRGGHTFYTYIDSETLEFAVTKQDMNWYDGSDDLKITVYSNSDQEKGNITIPDDGDSSTSHAMGPKQTRTISIPGLETGVYKIVMAGGGDLYIQNISTKQDKLVAEKKLFVISPAELYTESISGGYLGFLTYHDSAYQDIRVQNSTLSTSIKIDRSKVQYKTYISPSSELCEISLPVGDMVLTSDGYFAFTKHSYFNPVRCNVVTLQNNLNWIKNNAVDYIVINSMNTTNEGEWVTAETQWDIKDLYVNGDTLSFATNTDHFEEYPNNTIPIDWIRINLTEVA
jgi:hypothetical protein